VVTLPGWDEIFDVELQRTGDATTDGAALAVADVTLPETIRDLDVHEASRVSAHRA
jgi:hypothetical protein